MSNATERLSPLPDPATSPAGPNRLTSREVFRRNVTLVRQAASSIVPLVAILQIIGGLLGGMLLYAIGRVIDTLAATDTGWGSTWPWIAVLAVVTAVAGLITSASNELQRLVGEQVRAHTSDALIRSSAGVQFERFDDRDFYDRMRRAHDGSQGNAFQIVWSTLGITRSIVDITVIVVVIGALAPVLLPIALSAYIPLFFTSRASNRLLHRFDWDLAEDDRRRDYLASLFTGRDDAREVRMFELGRWFGDRHRALWADRLVRLRSVVRRRTAIALVGSFASSTIIALALGLVAWLASSGDLSLAAAGVGILGVHRISGAVTRLDGFMAGLHRSALHMRDYENYLAEAAAVREQTSGRAAPARVDTIEIADLSFRYQGARRNAVQSLRLALRRGEVLAIVGPNGSGKSTLMMLLCGLYKPTEGTIRWDGVDVNEFDPASLRARIAPMFQDSCRYELTVRQNVAVSRLEALEDDALLSGAIDEADAASLIGRLHHGADTMASRAYDDGIELSGGEWQRLAVARALFHGGSFLALDEPSADLDPLAEQQLITRLKADSDDRVTVFISHRFAAVRQADRIAVLQDGRLVEEGTHEDLMANRALYRSMYEAQLGATPD